MTALTRRTGRALTQAEFGELEHDVESFVRLCDSLKAAGLAKCKAALAGLPALRARWAAVDRPVTTNDITAEMLRLTAAFSTNTARADMDGFVVIMAEDVADLRPTVYGLNRACKQYRSKYRFLGISDLVTEIKKAERITAKLRDVVLKFPLEEDIADFEQELPRLLAKAKTVKRRRLTEWYVWRYLKAKGVDDFIFQWMFDYWPPESKRRALNGFDRCYD
jgi:hypothetical protein